MRPRPSAQNQLQRGRFAVILIALIDAVDAEFQFFQHVGQALLQHVGSPEDIPGGGGMESSHFLDVTMEFREFCCPGCFVLMTTEILPAGTPSAPEMRFAAPQARG